MRACKSPPLPVAGGFRKDERTSAGRRQADVLVDRSAVEVAVHVRLDNGAVRAVSGVRSRSRDETEDRGAGERKDSGDALHGWGLLPRADVDTPTTRCGLFPRGRWEEKFVNALDSLFM